LKVLLDTCVLSELRRPQGHSAVKVTVAEISDESLFVSVLTIGEITKGISLLAQGQKKQALTVWLTGLEAKFAERILTVDIQTAQLWGDLTGRLQKKGILIPAIDGLLAATALKHGMQIMTRNAPHFEASGAMIIDPWAA